MPPPPFPGLAVSGITRKLVVLTGKNKGKHPSAVSAGDGGLIAADPWRQ
ncbi:hypothetical protein ACQP1V_12720 [Microtetraspora malaysiensis]